MSKVYQFTFEKTYKELDINGKIYRIETNEDAQKRYRTAYKAFVGKAGSLAEEAPDFMTCSDEEFDAFQDKNREVSKHIIETFLGEGTFEEIYELAGRSILNLVPLIEYISEMIISKEQAEQAQQYMKNVKK